MNDTLPQIPLDFPKKPDSWATASWDEIEAYLKALSNLGFMSEEAISELRKEIEAAKGTAAEEDQP